MGRVCGRFCGGLMGKYRGGRSGTPRPDLAQRNRDNATHGMTGSPTYRSWSAMRDRCLCPTNKDYPNWGGRGITICARWDSFERFFDDMGERPDGLTLDRIDTNGNYTPDNCRWATQAQQSTNKRNNKLTRADVDSIIRLRASGSLLRVIAAQFRVAESMVSRIVNGTRRVHA